MKLNIQDTGPKSGVLGSIPVNVRGFTLVISYFPGGGGVGTNNNCFTNMRVFFPKHKSLFTGWPAQLKLTDSNTTSQTTPNQNLSYNSTNKERKNYPRTLQIAPPQQAIGHEPKLGDSQQACGHERKLGDPQQACGHERKLGDPQQACGHERKLGDPQQAWGHERKLGDSQQACEHERPRTPVGKPESNFRGLDKPEIPTAPTALVAAVPQQRTTFGGRPRPKHQREFHGKYPLLVVL